MILSQLNCVCGCTAGEDCSQWPLLTTYNWTDNMFTCSGNITGFAMCNKGNNHIDVGLSLWRQNGIQDTSVKYLRWVWKSQFTFQTLTNYDLDSPMSYHRGDQLMVLVIYYGSSFRCVRTHV